MLILLSVLDTLTKKEVYLYYITSLSFMAMSNINYLTLHNQ